MERFDKNEDITKSALSKAHLIVMKPQSQVQGAKSEGCKFALSITTQAR